MRIVILGNGIAAERMLKNLFKDKKAEDSVVLVGKEKYGPYSRIRLPEYIAGTLEADFFKKDSLSEYEGKGLEVVRENEAVGIDRNEKKVVLSDGSTLSYDKLVLAIGSNPRRMSLEGSGKKNISSLRTILDADRIIENKDKDFLVIGGGLLGLESAHAIAELTGRKVRVLETFGYLLPRQMDEKAALFLEKELNRKGLEFIKGRKSVKYLEKDADTAGALLLEDGTEVEASFFVEAIGVIPNTEMAKAAGLEVNRAIVVNEKAETNDSSIYAVGDSCEYNGLCPGLVSFALETTRVASSNILGKEASMRLSAPSAFITVAGIECYSIGRFSDYEKREEIVDGDRYESFFLDAEGNLIGSISIGSKANMSKVLAGLNKKFEKKDYIA